MTTLILLPGLACDAALWRHQQPLLAAAGAPVVVADAHHHADSLPAMAERLLAQHTGPLALAGASMGGMLALEAQRRAPQRVRGLALLGTTARADTPEMRRLRGEAIALFGAGRMDEVLRINALFAFHRAHAARLLDDYLAMLRRAGADGLIRQNRAVMARADLRPALAGVACPTLVVGGLDDTLTPPECARELAAGVAGARLELLADCGHMLTMEKPAPLNRLLAGWLAGLSR
jgi:pimeloyl-ACP methyl ester carboxylesterase